MLKKLLQIAKLTLQMMLVMLIGCCISYGIYVSVTESIRMPTMAEMGDLDNISGDLNSKESHVVDLSRQSIVQVLTTSEKRSGFSKMSGTYAAYGDRFYVILLSLSLQKYCPGANS